MPPRDPAARAAALLSALIRHRPLPSGNEQAAVLATVTFLAIRLRPAEVITPPGIRDYDTRIELARQAKDAAVDAKDLDRAAAARDSEKELLAERDRLIARWSAGVDVGTLGRELDWLRDEVNRLQRLLLEHGLEPEQSARRPEAPEGPGQQTA